MAVYVLFLLAELLIFAWKFLFIQILNNIGSVFARNREYERALKPWEDAIHIYKNAGLVDDDPKVSCTMGNIEISKRFVSSTPSQKIRQILNY